MKVLFFLCLMQFLQGCPLKIKNILSAKSNKQILTNYGIDFSKLEKEIRYDHNDWLATKNLLNTIPSKDHELLRILNDEMALDDFLMIAQRSKLDLSIERRGERSIYATYKSAEYVNDRYKKDINIGLSFFDEKLQSVSFNLHYSYKDLIFKDIESIYGKLVPISPKSDLIKFDAGLVDFVTFIPIKNKKVIGPTIILQNVQIPSLIGNMVRRQYPTVIFSSKHAIPDACTYAKRFCPE